MRFRTLALLAAFPVAAWAQPTLNLGNMQPSIGTTFTFADAAYQSPGAAGANVTWDLSGLIPTTTPVSFTYVDPAATTGAAYYPGATSAWQSGSGVVNYQAYSSTSLQDLGTWFGLGYVVFNDPIKNLPFPLSYNTSWSDDYAGTAEVFGTTTIDGSLTATVDAYGTLILPAASFTNVLRVRMTKVETTVTAGQTTTIVTESHLYLKAGIANPLLEQRTTTTTPAGGSPVVEQTLTYQLNAVIGLEEVLAAPAVTVTPSLTAGPVEVRTSVPAGPGSEFLLLDPLGRIVRRMAGASLVQYIDLSGEAPGRYALVVAWPDGRRATAPLVRQ